jgi:anti-sigma-K factor RskA
VTDHDAIRDAAGAWVLGALDEEEAWGFAAHLEVCESCRQEVARLQVAADALPLAAPAMEPPPALKERLMSIVEEEARAAEPAPAVRRRPRWVEALFARPAFATAAACLLLVAGGVVGFAISGGSEDAATTVAFEGAGRAELVQRDGEAAVRVTDLDPPPRGRVYQLWIKRPGNPAPEPDAVFTVDREGHGSVEVQGDVEGAEAVLVTTEPSGGSQEPSTQPFLSAEPA